VILAVPPVITNTYLAVDNVDPEVVDAARGMGMSGTEVLARVELPLAVPLMFAGIRTASVFVLSTTTIASLAGFSGSLGDIIANETSYHFAGVLGAAICVAGLTLVVDGLLALAQRALTPRGVRLPARERAASARIARLAAAKA
jgi:osmoprotectant transport system permease protein